MCTLFRRRPWDRHIMIQAFTAVSAVYRGTAIMPTGVLSDERPKVVKSWLCVTSRTCRVLIWRGYCAQASWYPVLLLWILDTLPVPAHPGIRMSYLRQARVPRTCGISIPTLPAYSGIFEFHTYGTHAYQVWYTRSHTLPTLSTPHIPGILRSDWGRTNTTRKQIQRCVFSE